MFFIDTNHDGKEKRHNFHNEKYARGYLRATYHDILWDLELAPERYEIVGNVLTDTEYRISVKDKSRLYFLNRAADIKNVTFTGRLGRQVTAQLA